MSLRPHAAAGVADRITRSRPRVSFSCVRKSRSAIATYDGSAQTTTPRALDIRPIIKERFWELVTELRLEGCAVLVISHLFFEQQRFDVLYRLQEGQVRIQDKADLQWQSLSSGKEL